MYLATISKIDLRLPQTHPTATKFSDIYSCCTAREFTDFVYSVYLHS